MKKKTKLKVKGQCALTRVRKYFPQVNHVTDADESVVVTVKQQDSQQGRRKAPEGCALARACVRSGMADHAIIGIGYSYLIKGDKATRYKTSVAVGREITSFDRHHEFAAGTDYRLSRVPEASKLGNKPSPEKSGPRTGPPKSGPLRIHNHKTDNIRVMKH